MILQKRILKTALSFLQKHEGLPYETALLKISKVIVMGAHGDNPVLAQLIDADLPSDPAELHQLLTPSSIHA